jgi:hypothetical protein
MLETLAADSALKRTHAAISTPNALQHQSPCLSSDRHSEIGHQRRSGTRERIVIRSTGSGHKIGSLFGKTPRNGDKPPTCGNLGICTPAFQWGLPVSLTSLEDEAERAVDASNITSNPIITTTSASASTASAPVVVRPTPQMTYRS